MSCGYPLHPPPLSRRTGASLRPEVHVEHESALLLRVERGRLPSGRHGRKRAVHDGPQPVRIGLRPRVRLLDQVPARFRGPVGRSGSSNSPSSAGPSRSASSRSPASYQRAADGTIVGRAAEVRVPFRTRRRGATRRCCTGFAERAATRRERVGLFGVAMLRRVRRRGGVRGGGLAKAPSERGAGWGQGEFDKRRTSAPGEEATRGAKRCGCLRVRPSLRVSFQTRRSGAQYGRRACYEA